MRSRLLTVNALYKLLTYLLTYLIDFAIALIQFIRAAVIHNKTPVIETVTSSVLA